ncbi:MAG: rhodanese-like domain-containing protein [Proteobacteria bacterium]|nr:rhodanese-like domain-containing protein [Pseudomonadota bacterium]
MNAKIRFSFAAALFLCLAATLAQAEVVDIGNDQLKALIKQGTPVVDLRTAGEWRQTGVVKGSQMITLFDEQGRADPAAWARQVDKVAAADKPVILICRTGNRSGVAAQMLDKAGRKGKVYNVKAGIVTWLGEGQAVVSMKENMKQAGISCSPTC